MHRSARRIAAISFSSLRIEIARQLDPFLERRPLAVVIAREKNDAQGRQAQSKQAQSKIQDESSILGNTRIDEVSAEARRLGILPGFTVAAARAKCADLFVRVVLEKAAEEALARIAEIALAFGATVSFSTKEDTVWADVTGCAHLHDARNLDRGEKILAGKLAERVRLQGHEASVAVADGPRIALAFARHGQKDRGARSLVIAPDATKQAVSLLPVVALPVDDAAKHWLDKLGLKSAGDLSRLPRSSLGARLGAQARLLFSFLDGADVEPLTAYRPPQTPVERVDLEYGIEGGEALLFVVKMLSARLGARLEGRALGATELELTFELDDAARNRAKTKRSRVVRAITLAAPIRSETDLMAVARARIEAAERKRETFDAPILAVELAATKLARMESRELDLLSRETSGTRAFPLLVAELSADLGKEQVGILALQNSHREDQRAHLVPVGGDPSASKPGRYRSLPSEEDAPEPARFLPTPIAAEKVILSDKNRLIRRSGWIEWWKEKGPQRGRAHDSKIAWSAEVGATAWVDVDLETGQQMIRGWE